MKYVTAFGLFFITCLFLGEALFYTEAEASYHFSNYQGVPPIHTLGGTSKTPVGMTPGQIKKAYNLPASGGHGTIVIVGAYNDATLEADLAAFDKAFNLPACTTANGCFTKHAMSASIASNSGWAMETSLDVEWAHAVAPQAKILVVEATTPSGANLLKAVDYAASVKNASAISMSWGGAEFPEEVSMDSHFVSTSGAPFFASSGDNGAGASWPASSPNVIGVGGTTLALTNNGSVASESAWSGSGGGISAYEKEPTFQKNYSIPKAGGMRAIPDVAYDADPSTGFPIYVKGAWHTVGGTSAGAPQWAAIAALGSGVTNAQLYADKSTGEHAKYFRDITSGSNGSCGYFCDARMHYDYVTGLGSPQTDSF
ncbi:MAG TPA: S53 family peptidase [Candidatus Paceibacterota bacterium]|nr:S53 family peptidase [Candidatus Paceibacterota bacterium]